jgi:hypothetical protein
MLVPKHAQLLLGQVRAQRWSPPLSRTLVSARAIPVLVELAKER